jgi:hypothetical protein
MREFSCFLGQIKRDGVVFVNGWSREWKPQNMNICEPWCWYMHTYMTGWFWCSGKCWDFSYPSPWVAYGMNMEIWPLWDAECEARCFVGWCSALMGGLRIWGGHGWTFQLCVLYSYNYIHISNLCLYKYMYLHIFFTAGLKQKGATTQMNLEDDLTEPTHLPRPIGRVFPCKGAQYKGLKHFKPRRLVAIQMYILYKYTWSCWSCTSYYPSCPIFLVSWCSHDFPFERSESSKDHVPMFFLANILVILGTILILVRRS